MRRIEAGDTALQLRGEEAASLDPGAPAAHQQLYYALCRGETPGHSCAPARATCRLASHGRPGLLLAPLKLETVCQVQCSTVQYCTIQYLVPGARPRHHPRPPQRPGGPGHAVQRAQAVHCHGRQHHPRGNISNPIISPYLDSPQDAALEARLSRRLELVTGLAVANSDTEFAAEPHQVWCHITHYTLHITLHITHYR